MILSLTFKGLHHLVPTASQPPLEGPLTLTGLLFWNHSSAVLSYKKEEPPLLGAHSS